MKAVPGPTRGAHRRPHVAATLAVGLSFILGGCAGGLPPVQLAAGTTSSCTIDASGALWCWGNNDFGQLGIGNFVPFPHPRQVTFFAAVSSVSVGNGFACAIAQGALFCWGKNDFGQLGNGTTTFANTPTAVVGLDSDVTAVTAGGSHTCAVHQGVWKCWGNNFHGQLGRGPSHGIGEGAFETTPQMVFGPFGSLRSLTISAGDQHTCGTANVGGDRQLLCWGFNNLGQVGKTGGVLDVVSPNRVKSPTGFVPVGVAASSQHSCGLFVRSGVEHRVFCWGNNFQGKLGLGNDFPGAHSEPTLSAIDNTAAVVSSPNSCHTCSLARDGKMHCWGCNESGQLGDGTTTDRFSATKPLGMETGVLQIAVGGAHTCAWTVAGPRAFCWGKNNDGQLGVQEFANHSTATPVAGF